ALAQLERAVVTAEAQRQEMKERLTKNESSHQEASETQKKQWSMELESEQALRAESEHRWEMLSEELQRQKEELQEEYRRLQAAYHALEEHLDSDLEEALAESKRKATEAVEQVTALEDEKKQLKEEMNSMALKAQKELGEMRGELEKAATLKLEQVEKDLEEAQAGLRDQEALAAEEANLLQEAQEETTKLKEQLMKLEVDRIALEQQFQEDVKKVESEFKSKMFAAEEEAKQAKAGQSKLEGQISALRKEAEERVHLLTNDLKSEKVDSTSTLATILPVPMRRRCAWLYEAVLRLPADWIPDEDDAAQAPVGGVLRLPRYQVLIPEQDHPLHDAFGYVGFLLAEVEIDQFQSGHFLHVADALGCHCVCAGGVYGLRFATWAPRAVFVSVVGDWNNWDGRACPMAKRFRAGKDGGFCGLWEIFVPFGELSDVPFGQKYGFKIHTLAGTDLVKMDPYAQEMEVPSDLYHSPVFNASVISSCDDSYRAKPFEWSDEAWMQAREERGQVNTALLQPMAIYEVHLSSFRRGANGELMNYRDMAKQLVEHVKALNFNWVELMALAHHPFQGSWGYQVSGYYSCYSLLGSPDDLKYLINQLHEAKIGVIMDFVPAHFCKDACSFGDFDGTATFEYEDPREGEQRQWGTKVFNFRRNEVRSFLLGAALFWADRYHIDGFRCDAVSSMIYRNFGKSEGEWIRNEHGGDSNLEAVSLLRELNNSMKEFWPGVIMIAEESTAWEGVTSLRPASSSLGFDLKWDLGWMNDTLIYLEDRRKLG
ncbi:1, partial [Durusdinium trenchii]